jgi:hypothetical protein
MYSHNVIHTVCKSDVSLWLISMFIRGRRGRDRMVVIFTTTYAMGTYHH